MGKFIERMFKVFYNVVFFIINKIKEKNSLLFINNLKKFDGL